jgi:hypothetical protein
MRIHNPDVQDEPAAPCGGGARGGRLQQIWLPSLQHKATNPHMKATFLAVSLGLFCWEIKLLKGTLNLIHLSYSCSERNHDPFSVVDPDRIRIQ